jgi:hypothetical protein
MESDFDSRCPALDCGATWRPEKYRRQTLLHILWPAYEYQVIVPEPRERRINIFQKHIISLTLSGVKSADQIAGYLAIDPELAAFILLELRGLGLLDEAYELTRPGKALLDEERQSQQPKMTVGRVYQDPWTGKLWPRFLSERRASRLDATFLSNRSSGVPGGGSSAPGHSSRSPRSARWTRLAWSGWPGSRARLSGRRRF